MKNFYEMVNEMSGRVSYTAVVLEPQSQTALLNALAGEIPPGWQTYAHHMTINMGEPGADVQAWLGKKVQLTVDSLGKSNLAIAVAVNTAVPSQNKIKHVTVAVNTAAGGKPFNSNQIQNWNVLSNKLALTGIVGEVGYDQKLIAR